MTQTALKLQLTDRQTADFEMIGNGGFAPLQGPQSHEEWKSVVENMTLPDGQYWPIPIILATDLDVSEGDTVEISSDEGKPLGRLNVTEIFERDLEAEAENVYRTTDKEHPGVAAIYEEGARCIAGTYEVDDLPDHEEAFMKRYFTAEESRKAFEERGWKRVVAFQTRNPIHRAHEYLTKCALEITDGLFIHPLIGKTKAGDIPADVRMSCYEVLMEDYYPNDRVILGVFPSKMHYAGPREAVLHAIARRNYGCTHFIVGRDHAGVGDYYGTYDAQRSSTNSTSTSSASSRSSSSTPSGATSARAWRRARPARTDRRTTSSSAAPRSARCSATASCRPRNSAAPRWLRS